MSAWMEAGSALAGGWAGALWRGCWQGGLAIVLVWGLCRVLPRLPSAARCWLWRLAVAKLLLAFLWPAPVDLPLLPSRPALAPAAEARASAGVAAERPAEPGVGGMPTLPPGVRTPAAGAAGPPDPPDQRLAGTAWLMLLWLGGVSWCIARLGRERGRARGVLRGCTPVADGGAPLLCRELSARLGVRRPPALAACECIEGPLLTGVLRPVVLLPRRLLDASSQGDLRLVVAHELAHLRRRDLWWGWVLAAAQAVFFFHPLVWLAAREWRLAHEVACDELAIGATGAPVAEYGNVLLQVAERQSSRGFAVAGLSESHRMLRERLVAMRSLTGSLPRWVAVVGSLLLVSGAVGLVPCRLVPRTAVAGEETPQPGYGKPQALVVCGKVTDGARRPVPGATVALYDARVATVHDRWMLLASDPNRQRILLATQVSAPDGAFRFPPLPFRTLSAGRQAGARDPWPQVVVTKPGYGVGGNNPLGVHAVPGQEVQLDVPLPAPTTLEGSVTDSIGKPLACAVVSVYSLTVGPRPGRLLWIPAPFDRRFIARTNRAGAFHVPGLPQGSRAYFQVSSPGRASGSAPIPLARAPRTTLMRLRLDRAGAIEGRLVYGATGRPAAGALAVAYFGSGQATYAYSPMVVSGRAREDGRFRLTGLPGGAWNVGVYLIGPLATKWTARTVVVRAKPGRVVRGVRLALVKQGKAAPGARASAPDLPEATVQQERPSQQRLQQAALRHR